MSQTRRRRQARRRKRWRWDDSARNALADMIDLRMGAGYAARVWE